MLSKSSSWDESGEQKCSASAKVVEPSTLANSEASPGYERKTSTPSGNVDASRNFPTAVRLKIPSLDRSRDIAHHLRTWGSKDF